MADEDRDIYACVLADHETPVPSVTRYCTVCGRAVWLDRTMVDVAMAMEIHCMPCAIPILEKTDSKLMIHPKQVAAIDALLRRN